MTFYSKPRNVLQELCTNPGSEICIFKDFSYDENYFELWVMEDAGGPGLEFHQFDHIDMPLDEV